MGRREGEKLRWMHRVIEVTLCAVVLLIYGYILLFCSVGKTSSSRTVFALPTYFNPFLFFVVFLCIYLGM